MKHSLFILLLIFSKAVFGQTNVSGAISSNTTWNSTGSPYRVTGNLLVNSGVTLTILPGTVVEIYSGKSIQILGELVAIGAPQDSIYFQDFSTQSSFKSIEFGDSSTDVVFSPDGSYASGNILKYVVINGGGSGANGSVIFASSTGLIRHSSIRNSKSSGIHIYKNTTHVNTGWMGSGGVNKYVTVDSSNVTNNTSSGFNCACYQYNVSVSLKYNKLNSNGSSGFTSGGGDNGGTHEFIVVGNEFKSNVGKGYEGLTNGNQWVLENIIAENGSDGIRVRGNGTYRIRKNIIRDNNGRGIHGIYASIIVDSNVIYHNVLGIEASQGGDFKIRNNQILNNNSTGSSGVYASVFDPICSNEQKAWSTSVALKRNSFVNNRSDSGLIAIHNPDYGSPAFFIDSNNFGANHKKYIIYNSRNFSSANAIAPNFNFFNGNTLSSIGDSIKDWNINGNLSTVSPLNISQIPVNFAPTLPVKRAIIYPGTPNYIVFSANKSSAFNNYRLYRGNCLYEDFSTDSSIVTHFNVDSLSYYKITVRSNTALGCEDFYTGNESYYYDDIRLPFQIIGNRNFCFEDTPTFTIQKNNLTASQATYYIQVQLNNLTIHTDTINQGNNIFSWIPVSTLRNDSTYSLTVSSPSFGYSQSIKFKLSKKSRPSIVYTELAICSNTTASLIAPNSFTNVKWYRLQWGSAQNVANGSSYTASPGYSYYFTSTSPEGCIAYSDTVIVSTLNLPGASVIPAITASVPLNYCSGSNFTLSHAIPANYVQTVPANNLTPPTVRWYRNDTLISQNIYSSQGSQVFSINDSVPGTYKIQIGSSICYVQSQITLTKKPNVEITLISKTDNLCFGNSGGQIVVSSPNASSYVWSSPAKSNIPNNDTISNLPAGLYTLTASRSNGCSKTIQIQITQPPQIQLTATAVPVSCHGGGDGKLFLAVSNAVPPYSINWLNLNSSNDTITGLSAGAYSATVTDVNGCSVSGQFTVNQPNVLSLQASSLSHVSCFGGQNGAATVIVSGGNGGYVSTWRQPGSTSVLSTSTNLSGVSAGTYRYKVVDSKGCIDSVDVTITEPVAPLSASISTQVNVLCFGASTGSLSVQATGGTIGSGYSYLWKNSNNVTVSNSASAVGLPAGVYTCLITDTKGCTTLVSGTVLQPQAPVAVFTSGSNNVSCFGGSNGKAWLQPTGGVAPYTFLWSNQSTNDTIANLTAGNYSVTVTDNNGCTSSQSFTVTQPTLLTNSFTKSLFFGNTNISCPNGADGTIDLTPSGGTAPYTYLWSNSATNQDLNGLTAGTYTCTITDAKGCTSQAVVTLTDPNDHVWTSTVTDVSCNGDQNGAISMNITGGNAPYRVNWNSSANNSGQTEVTFRVDMSQTSVSSLGVGAVIQGSIGVLGLSNLYGNSVYIGNRKFNPGDTIYWRYFNGSNAETVPISCGAITSLSVFERYLVVPDHDTVLPVICFSSCNNCSGVSEQGFDGTIQTTTKSINKLGAGTYNFSLVDRNGCTSTSTVTVNQPSVLTALSTGLTNPTCPQNLDGAITIQSTGGTLPHSYLWSNGATSSSVSGLAKGNYWAKVTDTKGCRDSLYFTLTAPEPFDFEDICVLSVDSATGKNLVVWNKTPGQRTLEYRILKENAQGQFVQIGNQPYLNLSVFTDQSSNPQTQPDRYKIALLDSCGNSSDTSDFHRTIHLQSNLGSSGEVNLSWTPYLGKPVQSYEIWRWITSGNLVQIATVAASVNSYTDLNPPVASNVYYVVNAVFPSSCSPIAGKNTAFDISKSNILNQTGIGFNENQALRNMRVYPNPNGGVFTVEFSNIDDIQSVSIIDGVGRVIRHIKTVDNTKILLDLSNEPRGIYRINATYSNGEANVPIVVH